MTSAQSTSRAQSRTFGTKPSAISRSFSSSMQYRTWCPSFATCQAMSLMSPVIETKRNLRLSPFIETAPVQRDYALSGAVCEQSGNLLPQKNPRRNGRSAIQTLQLWGSATHFEYEIVSVD